MLSCANLVSLEDLSFEDTTHCCVFTHLHSQVCILNQSKYHATYLDQQVLSSAGGVLSMQSLLCAIGIGASEALPLAATLNWVIKDGLGQLGGVIFASVVRWRSVQSLVHA